MLTPRPHHEWTEEDGDVLWWLWPIEEAPWVGSPLDLGRVVRADLVLSRYLETGPSTHLEWTIGGWPFREEDLHRVFWTRLPDAAPLDVLIRDHIRGGPDEP